MSDTTCYTYMPSPVGELLLVARSGRLTYIEFDDGKWAKGPRPEWIRSAEPFRDAVTQLGEYFAGRRREFDLQLDPSGTPFQQAVWEALSEIPFGQTRSYAQIARRIGRPTATRAVGAANGRNPISIVVPCHRVIGANGALTGFGGGLDVKRYLLTLEQDARSPFQSSGHSGASIGLSGTMSE